MSQEIPKITENKEAMEDNARKFTLDAIDPKFLKDHNISTYTLSIDWITVGEGNDQKLVLKTLEDGVIQRLVVSKTTKDGNRVVVKKKINEEEYNELLKSSKSHLKKKRYELKFVQNNHTFLLKYDEFADNKLRLLEVDAETKEVRNSFSPADFPYKLKEVTGDMQYYAHRVVDIKN